MLHTQPPARSPPPQPSHSLALNVPPSPPTSSQARSTSPVKSNASGVAVSQPVAEHQGRPDDNPENPVYINRWSSSTSSSRRSSRAAEGQAPPENEPGKVNPESGGGEGDPSHRYNDGNDNYYNTNNSNNHHNGDANDYLIRSGPPLTTQQPGGSGDLASSTAATSMSAAAKSEAIPELPPISDRNVASGPLGSDRETVFHDFDFFGHQTEDQSPATTALHSQEPSHALTQSSSRSPLKQDNRANSTGSSRPAPDGVANMGTAAPGRPQDDTLPPTVNERADTRHRLNSSHDRGRRQRGLSQKTVLSKALQKANTAVLLDNAMNYEGAIEAYSDACDLLQQVMLRTVIGEERQKLQEIRSTYITRINELRRLGLAARSGGKALPERPLSQDSLAESISSPLSELEVNELDYEQDVYEVGTATSARILGSISQSVEQKESRQLLPSQIPPRRQSLLPSAFDSEVRFVSSGPLHGRTRSNSSGRGRHLHSSPGKPASPDPPVPQSELPPLPSTSPQGTSQLLSSPSDASQSNSLQHAQVTGTGSTSWLDTIDESGVSSDGSLRSNSPTIYLRPKHRRSGSGGTEAEFDAALDAAVEAAYDQGFEPDLSADEAYYGDDADDPIVSHVRRNIELAKQRVREAEREAQALSARDVERRRVRRETLHRDLTAVDSQYDDYEAEEEDRILEEIMDDFDFDIDSKSALPRQSGSSSFSGRITGSSVSSNFKAIGTPLSTLAEEDVLPPLDTQDPKRMPAVPPLQSLPSASAPPPPPSAPISQPPLVPQSAAPVTPPGTGSAPLPGPSVRERRLSGQNARELVIETHKRLPPGSEAPHTMPPSVSLSHSTSLFSRDEPKTSVAGSWKAEEQKSTSPSENMAFASTESLPLQSPVVSSLTKTLSHESSSASAATLPSAGAKTVHDTGLSSKKTKPPRPIKVSIPSEGSSQSPSTPVTAHPDLRRAQTFMSLPAHATQDFFDMDIHSPSNPGFPNPSIPDPPLPLEACPQSFLLRPFWLMRCLYQTISHPRGGYLTKKLFIPSDIWRVRNVKIKAVDEKIANCDLLTAALLKLAKVDMYDADAVLDEMQSLETILDQVQAALSKKLGNEVGVQGAMSLFKMADDGSPMGDQPFGRSSSSSGKSYLSSWRKLRSKSSGTSSVPSVIGSKDGSSRDTMTLNSLPMTESPKTHYLKKSVTQLQFTGPNANYMSALARLFDAAQVLDQIACQVEDPGLRHSSQTLVGLELSTRHAAEFFGFYICRFVLNDIGLMLDKFIKRSSEWIMI
ncbi:hypothetical protein VTO42DRAFT_5124 [Malbranchea cinnamomea]